MNRENAIQCLQVMKCPECDLIFEPKAANHVFCSRKCSRKYRRKHGAYNQFPSITFTCAKCGRTVVTEGGKGDKRTRFCSEECERKYWKHPPHEHESTRINFSSLGAYERYEKKTNA